MDIKKKDAEGKKIYKAGPGCEKCFNQGYTGRAPIHELLVMDDDLKELLMKTQDASAIRKVALDSGMITLRNSAVQKVLAGITSVDEAISKTQTDELEM